MNTNYAYKKVLTLHQSPRMVMRPRTAMRQRRRQAIIGAGISVFIITLGFVITLNVSDTTTISAAVTDSIEAVQTDAAMSAGKFTLTYSCPEESTVEISVMKENGSDMICTTQHAKEGINYFEKESAFEVGVYFVKLKSKNREEIIKVINE